MRSGGTRFSCQCGGAGSVSFQILAALAMRFRRFHNGSSAVRAANELPLADSGTPNVQGKGSLDCATLPPSRHVFGANRTRRWPVDCGELPVTSANSQQSDR